MEKLLIFLEINIILGIVYLSFRFLLRDLSFHNLNRVFLLSFSILAIVLPFMDLNTWFLKYRIDNELIKTTYINLPELIISNKKHISGHNYIDEFFKIYFGFSMLIFVMKLTNLVKFVINNPKKIALSSGSFSFLGRIYLNQDEKQTELIVNHEMVHKNQFHFIDLIFFELVKIVFWANPFAYKLSKEIKIVHEFLADRISISKIQDKEKYIKLLLDSSFKTDTSFLFVQHFHNQSILKLRITMLLKQRSHQIQLVKYVLLMPMLLIGIIYLLSSFKEQNNLKIGISKLENQSKLLEIKPISKRKSLTTANYIPSKTKEIIPIHDDFNVTKDLSEILSKTINYSEDSIYNSVDVIPEFPGGVTEMYKYLGNNIKYPAAAQRAKVSGKVFIKFIVEKDGSIGETTIMKGIGFGCDQEATRVIKSMPKWTPGLQKGKAVRVYYIMPIVFNLK
jgi:TonB family protein